MSAWAFSILAPPHHTNNRTQNNQRFVRQCCLTWHARIFSVLKNAVLGPRAQANHLTYIGDAEIGERVNVGAGTITCNYDGFAKHRTVIGSGAFLGSNTALVAPVTVGTNAIVGPETARGAGRERGGQYVWISVVRVSLKKKK